MKALLTLSVIALFGLSAHSCSTSEAKKKRRKFHKRHEVANNLKAMAQGAIAYFKDPSKHHDANYEPTDPTFPKKNGAITPSKSCCVGKKRVKCNPSGKGKTGYKGSTVWAKEPWPSLSFKMVDRHYFRYEYKVISDTEVHVIAWGDWDCDGKLSKYWHVVKASGNDCDISKLKYKNWGE